MEHCRLCHKDGHIAYWCPNRGELREARYAATRRDIADRVAREVLEGSYLATQDDTEGILAMLKDAALAAINAYRGAE